jgi:hypothetical protein
MESLMTGCEAQSSLGIRGFDLSMQGYMALHPRKLASSRWLP